MGSAYLWKVPVLVSGPGLRVKGSGIRLRNLSPVGLVGHRASRLRVWGSEFKVSGLGQGP